MAFIPDDANKRIRKELSPNAGDMYRALCEYRRHEYRIVFLTQANGEALEEMLASDWAFPFGSQRNALTELAKKGWIRRHPAYIELLVGDFSPVDDKHARKELPAYLQNTKRQTGRRRLEDKESDESSSENRGEQSFPESVKTLDFWFQLAFCFHEIVNSFHGLMNSFPETVIQIPGFGKSFPESGKTPFIGTRALIPSQTPARDQPNEEAAAAAARGAPARASPVKLKFEEVALTEDEKKMSKEELFEHFKLQYPHLELKLMREKMLEFCNRSKKRIQPSGRLLKFLCETEKKDVLFDNETPKTQLETEKYGGNGTNRTQFGGGGRQPFVDSKQQRADANQARKRETMRRAGFAVGGDDSAGNLPR